MNKYQLNAPQHATHYNVAENGAVTYYHIDNAIFIYEFNTWVEVDYPINLELVAL